MKNLLTAVLVCLVAAVFTGCSSNSPRSVAEKAIKCMQQKDIRGYMDLVYFPEENKAQKDGMIQMYEEKAKDESDDSEIIESFKFLEESIDEDAGTATEVFDVTYKDGSTKQQPVKMVRDDNGKWWVKMEK